jgi:GNAT superfamily N-acetyltransferase
MAQTAANLLLERIKAPARPIEFVEYPSTLVIRESTGSAVAECAESVELMVASDTFSLSPAAPEDLPGLLALIEDDQRLHHGTTFDAVAAEAYDLAFAAIRADPAQLLVAVHAPSRSHPHSLATSDAPSSSDTPSSVGDVVATMQLTFIPGLSRGGGTRLQIEAVLVREDCRNTGLGSAMLTWALKEGRRRGAYLAQLTTATSREGTDRFYRRLGFEPSHTGFKITL